MKSTSAPEAIAALRDPACYPHPAEPVELIETHISWVFLAGEYAYKVKKPVDLGFLDFSTLQARRFYCEEELRLNRRTAPELYLGVVPITAGAAGPRLGGTGEPIEYALKMRRFPQEALADSAAKRGELGAHQIAAIAAAIAAFHAVIPAAPEGSAFGAPEHVAAPALANFGQLRKLDADPGDAARLERLRAWTESEGSRLREVFAGRKRGGFVRECHGDLHLRNIVFLEGRPLPFDCIEFDPELRWIDVASEVAFLAMDLLEHGLEAAAWRFLNAYFETTGDYAGVRVLRYYLVYRAMVRAKIACIRARQPGTAARGAADLKARFLIVWCRASEAALRRRVAQREAAGNDASEAGVAVLENQIVTQEPLVADELAHAAPIDSESDETGLQKAIGGIAARLAGSEAAHA